MTGSSRNGSPADGGPRAEAPRGHGLSVIELMILYLRHADDYYRDPDGGPSDEIINIKAALPPSEGDVRPHGRPPRFGPLAASKTLRQGMVDAGLCRSTINCRVGRVKRMFKWAVANEHLPPAVFHGLQAVDGLRAGRGKAKEPIPVKPVSAEHVEAILPLVTHPVRAMIEVQAFCGARPGEITQMRERDIDRSGPVWIYRPRRFKGQTAGRARVIPLGPKAQEVLAPFLGKADDVFLFSPVEASEQKFVERRRARKTPMTPSQRKRTRKAKPKRAPRDRYDKNGYRQAVARACKKAGIPAWHPHQLRHSAATRIRAVYGLEAAQVVLGHAKADVTQVYAERDTAKAIEVMREAG